MKIQGLDAAVGMLRELAAEDGPRAARGIVRKGLRTGGKVLLEAARAMAPKRSGKLAASVKLRGQTRKGVIGVSVGTRAKDFTGPTFYASFVMWGHRAGPRRLGAKRVQVPANDFLARAFDQHGESAANTAAEAILDGIQKAAES